MASRGAPASAGRVPRRAGRRFPRATRWRPCSRCSVVRVEAAPRVPPARLWNELDGPLSLSGRGPAVWGADALLLGGSRGENGWAVWPSVRRLGGWRRATNGLAGAAARREHLPRVIANSRFLMLPRLARAAPGFAGVWGLALRQVAGDWQERYGYAPCWWKPLWRRRVVRAPVIGPPTGQAWGRRKGAAVRTGSTRARKSVKRVFVYALHAQARERLGGGAAGSAPTARRLGGGGIRAGRAWATSGCGNGLLTLARDFYARPQATPAPGLSESRQNQSRLSFLRSSGHVHGDSARNRIMKRPDSAWPAKSWCWRCRIPPA